MLTLTLLLFVCHFLADYTQLSTPWMLRAKKFGSDAFPILCHALVHCILMGIVLLFYCNNTLQLTTICLIQLLSHFLIDLWKGRLTYLFDGLRDSQKYPFWILMGFDQLLHQSVILLMVYLVFNN